MDAKSVAASKRIMSFLGLALFLAGLGLFAYLGFYNRYWADDWCYNADLKQLGFWGTLEGYTYITTYASNRFSLTLFSGLLDLLGIFGVQAMTLVVVGLWYAGLFQVLRNLAAIIRLQISSLHLLLFTAVIVYYSIYLVPHLYQSLYWRSGLLPYTAPLVFGVWIFALITRQAVRPARNRWIPAIAALLAFLAGGFSEAGAATLAATLMAYGVAAYGFRQRAWARDSFPTAAAALAASLLAMVVLIAAPTNAYRLGLYGQPAGLLEFLGTLLYFTSDFIKFSFLDMPLPHLILLVTLFSLGFLYYRQDERKLESKQLVFLIVTIALLTFLFVAATYAPSTYIEKSPPAPRTRVLSRFLLTLGLGTLAGLTGYYARQVIRWPWMEAAMVLVLLGAYVYGARSIYISSANLSLYAERAAIWDERDALIRQSQADGTLEVHVRGVDGLPVGGIRDFKDQRGVGFWINQCAARYYGVDVIYATLP